MNHALVVAGISMAFGCNVNGNRVALLGVQELKKYRGTQLRRHGW